MSTRIVIAGAGGFGRELAGWIAGSERYRNLHHIDEVVFIEDGTPGVASDIRVVSTISQFQPGASDLVLCAIGAPAVRRAVTRTLLERGARFGTFVDDRAVIGPRVTLGEGTIVCPGTVITADITVGAHTTININCAIGHDVVIGDYVTLSPACNLMGGVRVDDGAFFGTAVTVVPRISVGSRSLIGVGSVVLKSVPADVTSFGNPSVTVKHNAKPENWD